LKWEIICRLRASLKTPKTRLAQFLTPEFTPVFSYVNEEVKIGCNAVFGVF
jgi:hypothetical protein